jgi:hypothetical protein
MATKGYIDNCFEFKVEKNEIGRPLGKPFISMEPTSVGVLHTTEGSSVKGAVAALTMAHSAPHFVVGENRIIQTRPIGVQGAALHDPANRRAYVQIEIVAFSKQTLWLPDASSLKPLIALVAFAKKEFGIPLSIPLNWADDCNDLKGTIWASNNKRRQTAAAGAWETESGWWQHMEVPLQGPSWHWDCGAMQRSSVLASAAEKTAAATSAPG